MNKDADVAGEFNRLVKEKGWKCKQAKYQRIWCFGKSTGKKIHIIIEDDDSYSDNSSHGETSSHSNTDSDWDVVSNAGSHTGFSDYSIISAEGGVLLTRTPDSTTTLSNEFEQLAIRHANAVEARSNVPVSVSNKLVKQATQQNEPRLTKKQRRALALEARSNVPVSAATKPKKPAKQQTGSGQSKKQRRAEALAADFGTFFGSDCDGLEGWQKLCEIVGLPSDLNSVTQYKKARYVFPTSVEVFLLTMSRL